jgi:hypothetical protein
MFTVPPWSGAHESDDTDVGAVDPWSGLDHRDFDAPVLLPPLRIV